MIRKLGKTTTQKVRLKEYGLIEQTNDHGNGLCFMTV